MLFVYLRVITVKITKKQPAGLEEGSDTIQVWCLGFRGLTGVKEKLNYAV